MANALTRRGWRGEMDEDPYEEYAVHNQLLPYQLMEKLPSGNTQSFKGTPWPVSSDDIASPERYEAIRRGELYAGDGRTRLVRERR